MDAPTPSPAPDDAPPSDTDELLLGLADDGALSLELARAAYACALRFLQGPPVRRVGVDPVLRFSRAAGMVRKAIAMEVRIAAGAELPAGRREILAELRAMSTTLARTAQARALAAMADEPPEGTRHPGGDPMLHYTRASTALRNVMALQARIALQDRRRAEPGAVKRRLSPFTRQRMRIKKAAVRGYVEDTIFARAAPADHERLQLFVEERLEDDDVMTRLLETSQATVVFDFCHELDFEVEIKNWPDDMLEGHLAVLKAEAIATGVPVPEHEVRPPREQKPLAWERPTPADEVPRKTTEPISVPGFLFTPGGTAISGSPPDWPEYHEQQRLAALKAAQPKAQPWRLGSIMAR